MDWQFLVNCADDFEAGLIMGALEEAGIATIKKYRGTGDSLKAMGGLGKDVDIFVPAGRLEKAREVLDFLKSEAEKEAEEEYPDEEYPEEDD